VIKELIHNIKSIWYPDMYHGHAKDNDFFEGWYYKIYDKSGENTFAVIPGIIYSETSDHSFIQFYNGIDLNHHYFEFPVNVFSADLMKYHVNIKNNIFSRDKIKFRLKNKKIKIDVDLNIKSKIAWPFKIFGPNIMGFFIFLPFMECYYDVLSMKTIINGTVKINGKEYDFNDGTGYIEKNWGRSFPSSWIWLQGNNFDDDNSAFLLSIANIPYLGLKFNGFTGALFFDNKRYVFGTYNNYKIKNIEFSEKWIFIILNRGNKYLEITVTKKEGQFLPYPTYKGMEGKIYESLRSEIEINFYKMTNKTKKIIFSGRSSNCGLEISDKAEELLPNKK